VAGSFLVCRLHSRVDKPELITRTGHEPIRSSMLLSEALKQGTSVADIARRPGPNPKPCSRLMLPQRRAPQLKIEMSHTPKYTPQSKPEAHGGRGVGLRAMLTAFAAAAVVIFACVGGVPLWGALKANDAATNTPSARGASQPLGMLPFVCAHGCRAFFGWLYGSERPGRRAALRRWVQVSG